MTKRPNYMHKPSPEEQTLEYRLVTELSGAAWDAQCYIEDADAAGQVTPEVLREFASRVELLSQRAFRAAEELERTNQQTNQEKGGVTDHDHPRVAS